MHTFVGISNCVQDRGIRLHKKKYRQGHEQKKNISHGDAEEIRLHCPQNFIHS